MIEVPTMFPYACRTGNWKKFNFEKSLKNSLIGSNAFINNKCLTKKWAIRQLLTSKDVDNKNKMIKIKLAIGPSYKNIATTMWLQF